MGKISKNGLKPSQRRILESGAEFFMRHGIRRVTVEEICRRAGVSKVTFYKYFSNKNRLALDILRRMIAEAEDRYRRIMDEDRPYAEKARAIIQLKLDYSRGMSSEMLNDLYANPDPEIAGFLKRKLSENQQTYLREFRDAQEKGEIRRDLKPEFILYFINLLFKIMEDGELLKMYDSAQDLTRELIHFFFYGILSRPLVEAGAGGPEVPDRKRKRR